jgi:hypothetical protein
MLEVRITRVRDNQARLAGAGGYLRNTDGSAFGNVKFRDNGGAVVSGGGLYVGPAVGDLAVTQNIFHDNTAGTGGAIYIENPATTGSGASVWVNNTVAYNSATTTGAGMYIEDHTGGSFDPEVYNAIHYFNPEVANDENIVLASSAGVTVDYSDIGRTGAPGNPWPGIMNINVDPLFRNDAARNLRLAASGSLGSISLCLDSGDDSRVPQDRLDIDDNGNVLESLPWDFDRQNDPDTTGASLRWMDVLQAPNTGKDTVGSNNPLGVVVDMGAYENWGIGDGGPGGGGE